MDWNGNIKQKKRVLQRQNWHSLRSWSFENDQSHYWINSQLRLMMRFLKIHPKETRGYIYIYRMEKGMHILSQDISRKSDSPSLASIITLNQPTPQKQPICLVRVAPEGPGKQCNCWLPRWALVACKPPHHETTAVPKDNILLPISQWCMFLVAIFTNQ